MDLYDPQTVGVMVFGSFMVISAIGIFLVSTFSMKETSYEEALAKQRKQFEKSQQQKVEKKKKEKPIEKKGKAKKKEDKPNEKIPEQEPADAEVSLVAESLVTEPTFVAISAPAPEKAAPSPRTAPEKAAPSPRTAPEKAAPSPRTAPEKAAPSPRTAPEKAASSPRAVPEKVAPSPRAASEKAVPSPRAAPEKAAPSSRAAPEKAAPSSRAAPEKAAPSSRAAPEKAAPSSRAAPEKAAPSSRAAPEKAAPSSRAAPEKAAPSSRAAPEKAAPSSRAAPEKAAPSPRAAPEKAVPSPRAAPEKAVPSPKEAPEKAAPSPKDKRKKEKKVTKAEPAPAPAVSLSQTAASNPSPVSEVIAKEVPIIAASPVGVQPSKPVANSLPMKKAEVVLNVDELKQEVAAKKKNVAKKKAEPIVTDSDGPLYLPYKTLVSTIRSMVFSEGEAQKLVEILTEKAGIIQDTWHTATQKGDPVTILKRQLEEKEKQLAAEHEDATAAKNKLRELSKELVIEKSRASGVETKLKEQLLAREQEINAVQTRMQTSYQDHVNEVQQLQGKIRTLQEQLENGPIAQLARLQQENSILRDALNQATSQMESKQNAELAKLRQECSRLTKELAEKSETLQQEEWARKSLDVKVAAYEKQVNQIQVSQQETEESFKKRLDEMGEELRKSQSSCKTLLAEAEKSKGDQQIVVDLQTKLMSSEAEVKQKSEDLTSLKEKLAQTNDENLQLAERIKSIEFLLDASQGNEVEKSKELQATVDAKEAEITQLQARFEEKDSQVSLLEKEVMGLKDTTEQQRIKNNDLREKNWQAMEALRLAEKSCEEKLNSFMKIKEEAAQQLNAMETQTKETLQSLFPEVTVVSQEVYSEWLQEFREKTLRTLNQQDTKTETSDLPLRLKEAEEVQSTLQAECDQYRTILAETEGMLKDLQKSVEEEEHVWKAKLATTEEELQKSNLEVKSMEETVEKLKSDLHTTEQLKEYISLMEAQLETQMNSATSECQNYSKEVEILRQLLSESQEQLDAAQTEAQKQSKELALVRQQLGEMKNHVHDGEAVGSHTDRTEHEPGKLRVLESQMEQTEVNLEDEQALRQKLAEEFEEERLDKEKKLTRDLGQAATKLQQLLKVTQEQLAKERETVQTLQNQLQEAEEDSEMKEGTSV
uniref:Ribosome-binding protein 1 isoform X3 n=1 Tax=Geotrypetes seraphini TaxID=260995 RepID=A0A6P8Q8E7_GEOSA|nr:ribosome-binding protein 1 isoform X3 [Geotrypetes seraphini]